MSAASITRRSRPAADTRDLLLAAAREAFAARGYEAATLDEVAAAAGFTKGACYVHFRDKESLLLAVCDRRSAEREEDARRTVAALASDPLSALERFLAGGSAGAGNLALEAELRAQSLRRPLLAARLWATRRRQEALLAGTAGRPLASDMLHLRDALAALALAGRPLSSADIRALAAQLLARGGGVPATAGRRPRSRSGRTARTAPTTSGR